jgi:hypothetical protein
VASRASPSADRVGVRRGKTSPAGDRQRPNTVTNLVLLRSDSFAPSATFLIAANEAGA